MATLRDVIHALSTRHGVQHVILLGRDGLPIDSACKNGVDPDNIAALVPSMIEACNQVGEVSGQGDMQTCAVETQGGYTLVTGIDADIVLGLFVTRDANVGTLLYELRRYRSAIAELL